MLSMTATPMMTQPVYVGIDTHKATHHAAIVDADGHLLADAQFDSGPAGDAELLGWLADREVTAVGVEQTGSYGAGLTRSLQRAGHRVVEVNSPDLAVRARVGKSDPIDAVMAANAVRSGRATAIPKQRTGVVESIRLIQVTRDSAVKSRTTALTQIQSLLIIAPDELRAQFGPTPTATQIVARARRWRADRTRLHQPTQAAKLALGRLARRIDDLGQEITGYDIALRELTAQAAPRLLALPQVGPVTAAQLLVTVGQAPNRITTDAKFARLCGIAPIPASSGTTSRMRLHRGGDRQANKAIYLITVGRLRNHQPAIDYMQRRTAEGMAKTDIIRAMKRHVARELFGALKADLKALDEL